MTCTPRHSFSKDGRPKHALYIIRLHRLACAKMDDRTLQRLESLRSQKITFDDNSLAGLSCLSISEQLSILQHFQDYTTHIRNPSALLNYFLKQRGVGISVAASSPAVNPERSAPAGAGISVPASSSTLDPERSTSASSSSQPASQYRLTSSVAEHDAAASCSQIEDGADTPNEVKHALLVKSPELAYLIACGLLTVVSRPWRLPAGWYGLYVANFGMDCALQENLKTLQVEVPAGLPTNCVVATVRLGMSQPQNEIKSPWADGPWCQPIESVVLLETCVDYQRPHGKQVFSLPDHVRQEMQKQMPPATLKEEPPITHGTQEFHETNAAPSLDEKNAAPSLEQSQLDGGTTCISLISQTQSQRLQIEDDLQCAVCSTSFGVTAPRCKHSCQDHIGALCCSCMRAHITATGPLPRCPMPNCQHELSEEDLLAFGEEQALEAWRVASLQRASNSLPGFKVHCPREGCDMVFEVENCERSKINCPACNMEFCSQCHQMYHFRTA